MIRADHLRAGVLSGALLLLAVAPAGAGEATILVSVSSRGAQTDAPSGSAAVSASGEVVAFLSSARRLTSAERDGAAADVFIRDVGQERTIWLSSGRRQAATRLPITSLDMSGDGSSVVFTTREALVSLDDNDARDAYVRERGSTTPKLVSVTSEGEAISHGAAHGVAVSTSGRYVAFVSRTKLHRVDRNGAPDVFLKDRRSGSVALVSVDDHELGADAGSHSPDVSSTGRHVAFLSSATDLTTSDVNDAVDVYVRDRAIKETQLVSVSTNGEQANAPSSDLSMSADGRFVAFTSLADNLVEGDTNGVTDVFVRDLVAGTLIRASVTSQGEEASGPSASPSLSADGRFVAFSTTAANIGGSATPQIVIHDLVNGSTRVVSVTANGSPGAGPSIAPAISGDGLAVAFTSDASDLVEVDKNAVTDIFLSRWME